MRRVTKIAAAGISTAALAFTATACGESSSSAGEDKGVGIVYDVGGRGDHSFNDSAAKGLDKAKAEFKVGTKELTAKTADTEADRFQKLTDLAEAGFNPVIGVGFSFQASIEKAATKYPDVTFGLVDSVVDAKNVDSITFTEEQGSYLAGVAAALKSKDKKIGFIGGVDIPLINKFEAGFVQGVTDTDSSAKVTTQYLTPAGDLSGFGSPDKGKEAAQGMLDKGIDVIYSAAGSSGNGAIEAISKQGNAWAIGVDSDQYQDASLAAYKKSILTSVIKNVDVAVYELIKSVKDGKPLTGTNAYSLKKDGVSLATSGDFITDIQDKIDAAKAEIVSGEITVKTTP